MVPPVRPLRTYVVLEWRDTRVGAVVLGTVEAPDRRRARVVAAARLDSTCPAASLRIRACRSVSMSTLATALSAPLRSR